MKRKLLLAATSLLCVFALFAPLQVSADKVGAALTCTTQDNVSWDIEGGYTDPNIQQTVSLYQGSQYIQHFSGNQTTKNAQITAQVSAQTSDETYTLYNSADNSGPAVATVVCTAKTVAAAVPPTPQSTTTQPSEATPATTITIPSTSDKAVAPAENKTDTTKPLNLTASDSQKSSILGILIALLIVWLVIAILATVSLWIVFRKAGRPGWGVIVPFYSTWLLFEMGGKPGWWTLVMLVPFVNLIALVVYVMAEIEIAKRFGKSALFGFFGLFLFGFVGWPYLAFSKARYTEPGVLAADEPEPPFNPVGN